MASRKLFRAPSEAALDQFGLHLDLPVKFTKVGAEFSKQLSVEEYDVIGAALAGIDRITPAWIGDYLNAYEAAWGERYAQATVLFHKEPGTLRNYKWIYGQIGLSFRNDKLHHSQYAAIVSTVESHSEREKWINKCALNDWDTQQLKDELTASGLRNSKPRKENPIVELSIEEKAFNNGKTCLVPGIAHQIDSECNSCGAEGAMTVTLCKKCFQLLQSIERKEFQNG